MSGRMLSEGLGKLSFLLMFVGFNLPFLVQHSLGLEGMPRRIYRYPDYSNWPTLNLISTIGSFILGIGVLVTVANVLLSLRAGQRAAHDPWTANTLTCVAQSPPRENTSNVPPAHRRVGSV